ncbi:MAG: hypothetical protein NTY38_16700 [Acidobacteria bacterium]|nr:hypothetical protein [Acidobacteriota bacterium]
MPEFTYCDRRAVALENDRVRVTILVEGGHIAEILDKQTGVNPLWTPPWPSIEPSTYSRDKFPEYGFDAECKLLAGIMGHNVCIDLFGGPTPEEAAAGMTVHGEASVNTYAITEAPGSLAQEATLPASQLKFSRRTSLAPGSHVIQISETVENLGAWDRPIAWTQHVTLGPPFLEKGLTQFRAPGKRSATHPDDFAPGHQYMQPGVEFDWPNVPAKQGGTVDLRVFTDTPCSAGFTTTLMDPEREQAYFMAWSPSTKVLIGYVWRQADFPWLGIWEENYSRTILPWNGEALTRGMEFGASPFPESRRQMLERPPLFGQPGYRWIPARTAVSLDYCAFITSAEAIPEDVTWDGAGGIRLGN